MKRAALVLLLFGCLAGFSYGTSNHNFGLGIIVGEPTGVSFKFWSSQKIGWDAGAAWSFVDGSFFQIHGDFLVHDFNLLKVDTGRMSFYYGAGARLKFGSNNASGSDTILSLRVPVGISYEFDKTPVELFLEVVPMLDLVPKTEIGMAGAIGFRYYF